MLDLFPQRPSAKRLLPQSVPLDEYLHRIGYQAPKLQRTALVHGHDHRKAMMGIDATQELLAAMQVDADLLDPACCGNGRRTSANASTTPAE
jgi:hypothetical protein